MTAGNSSRGTWFGPSDNASAADEDWQPEILIQEWAPDPAEALRTRVLRPVLTDIDPGLEY